MVFNENRRNAELVKVLSTVDRAYFHYGPPGRKGTRNLSREGGIEVHGYLTKSLNVIFDARFKATQDGVVEWISLWTGEKLFYSLRLETNLRYLAGNDVSVLAALHHD